MKRVHIDSYMPVANSIDGALTPRKMREGVSPDFATRYQAYRGRVVDDAGAFAQPVLIHLNAAVVKVLVERPHMLQGKLILVEDEAFEYSNQYNVGKDKHMLIFSSFTI